MNPPRPRRSAGAAVLAWMLLVALGCVIVARAHYTTDLSAFLPRKPTAAQRLLVEQLRDGIASRLILVGIEGADASERARISVAMSARLRADAQFTAISNGEPQGLDRDRALLFKHRYLLSPTVTPARFTAPGLHQGIQDTLDLLASPVGLLAKSLLPEDPTGEMLQIVAQLGSGKQPPTVHGVWSSRDGKRAVLVAQTRATGSDTDGQEQAMRAIRDAFNTATGSPRLAAVIPAALLLSGPGVFSVNARATIKQEVTRLSIISSLAIMALLLWVYRSFSALALGLIPVVSGAVAGIAAVALGFGAVHGITLGFGVTLIGESVDYSIYLFIQSQLRAADGYSHDSAAWERSLWPTIRLGVATSIAGFASLLPSAFPGLAQLGLFSISGLVAAALVTRFVLPHLLPATFAIRDLTPLGTAIAATLRKVRAPRVLLFAIPVAAALILYMHRNVIWNSELSALSPVSLADQQLDARLRSDIGAPDVRFLVVVSGPDQQSVLSAAEGLQRPLDSLVESGVIGGYESPALLLPSAAAQQTRRASLPDEVHLKSELGAALEGMPLRIDKLQPFLQDVAAARTQPLVTRADLAGTTLATGVDALLLQERERWNALLPLRIPASVEIDVQRIRAAITPLTLPPDVTAAVLDVKGEADLLYSTYLKEVLHLSLAGLLAITALLLFSLRSPLRVFRVVTPLALAVMAVAAALVSLGHQLTLLHVIGMLLIVAVGSNYALFFDRRANEAHCGAMPLTLASLAIANAATVVGFGVLGFSRVPILAALGSTVAPGAFLALVFAALLTRGASP